MALNRLWIPSPCYSSRGGSSVRLIVLHTAEGARTIEDLGHFFQNSANQVSSHTGADDKRGMIGEYVTRGNKAWTAASFNPVAVQIELCGFAAWSTAEWKNNHHDMLANCADWIREESGKFGIPITKLSASQAQGSGRGVCQHKDLGAGGGGHVDCGPGFPIDYVLDMARNGTEKPQEDDPEIEEEMQLTFHDGEATICWGNQYANGKYRLVFSCYDTSIIRVDPMGAGKTSELELSYDNRRQGVDIPKDCKIMTIRRQSGSGPICYALSKE